MELNQSTEISLVLSLQPTKWRRVGLATSVDVGEHQSSSPDPTIVSLSTDPIPQKNLQEGIAVRQVPLPQKLVLGIPHTRQGILENGGNLCWPTPPSNNSFESGTSVGPASVFLNFQCPTETPFLPMGLDSIVSVKPTLAKTSVEPVISGRTQRKKKEARKPGTETRANKSLARKVIRLADVVS